MWAEVVWAEVVWAEVVWAEVQRQIPLGTAVVKACKGGVLMRLYSNDLALTARYLCWFDCAFAIRRPEELRTAMMTLADALRKRTSCHTAHLREV
ncbi:MAG TPA: hypothetical protein P5121_21420 [Caldilineaceae bacterium]|nr:hypothetical protein [Caldilineaceae bacterium]